MLVICQNLWQSEGEEGLVGLGLRMNERQD